MKAALVLVDLQHDFLARRPLEPAPELLVARAAALLGRCRERGVPVVHVRMTVTRDPDNRLPHWKREGRWICVEGTPGHAFPDPLEPQAEEVVLDKHGFSAFEDGRLAALLAARGIDTVLLAGLYLHNCLRATAVDAWRGGRDVVLVEDAVGYYDPLEAELTTVFLRERGLRFLPGHAVAGLLATCSSGDGDVSSGAASAHVHRSPAHPDRILWSSRSAGAEEVAGAVERAGAARRRWQAATIADRRRWVENLAGLLADASVAARLATRIATDVGKPLRDARGEVARCRLLLEAAVRHAVAGDPVRTFDDGSMMRRVPLGTVAVVTPWNHPLAIAVGKIAPAVLHGNTVVWKPAPAASDLAAALCELMADAGWPEDLVTLVPGGVETARRVMNAPGVDAITVTGGPAAGAAARRCAALRHLPLQAELGGNNVAVVWPEADEAEAARLIAPAAFGFAGQRCTANRRVIVPRGQLESFLGHLTTATRGLAWGEPLDEATVVGPMISEDSRERVALALAAAAQCGHRVITPHAGHHPVPAGGGWYLSPAIVVCDDPEADIVQRESFGPVLVVQPADTWDHAIDLANGVTQGLVAAVFTDSAARWEDFRDRARAGILKWNRATADAGVEAPFGGWKASGIGPPEHGPANLEFYTRSQTLYAR